MLDSPARAMALTTFCFLLFIHAVWKIKTCMTHDKSPVSGLIEIAVAGLLMGLLPIVLYTEDVPNTLRSVSAAVTDMDLDPTHETTEDRTDFVPIMISMGGSFIMGGISDSYTVPVHVPARYSVLLHWDNAQVWVPVNGVTYRKLKIGDVVKLQLREQQEVTLFMKHPPQLVAGPIVALNDARNEP